MRLHAPLALLMCALCCRFATADDQPIRVGIIGADTSHAVAFTKTFNDAKGTGDVAKCRVVAVFPGGSDDIPESHNRVGKFTEQLKGMNVEVVDSVPALVAKVDAVLLESVDGRPHLEQAKPVFAAGRPVYIDKPLAGTLADAIAIDELGKKTSTPWFSSSSLRFGPKLVAAKTDPKLGDVVGATAWSPCHIESHHPDLYWYGIHGVEALYTAMGAGCVSVSRTSAPSAEIVTGVWADGRVGTFRGIHTGKEDYGVVLFGSKSVVPAIGFEGYEPLVQQIATFFVTRQPPVAHEETIEIMAFMEAADESKRQGGKPVTLQSVMEKARQQQGK